MVTARTRACVGCATAGGECTWGESRISYTAPPIPPPLATTIFQTSPPRIHVYRLGASVPDTPRSHLATQRAIGPSHPPQHLSNAGARLCTHGRRIDALAPSLADRAAHGLVTTLHRLTCLVVMAMVTARTRACVGCATADGECTGGGRAESATPHHPSLHHSPPLTAILR